MAERARTNWCTSPSDSVLAGEVIDVEITATEPWFLEGRALHHQRTGREALLVVA